MSFVKKMGEYLHNDPMWVIGCIDSYGAIHARHATSFGDIMHHKEESNGKRWRWNIWGQEFCATRAMLHDDLTSEEWDLVMNWLIHRGYANDPNI